MHRLKSVVLFAAPLLVGFDWAGRIDAIAAGLESSDPTRRQQIVAALGTFPTSSTRTHLLRALEDGDVGVRIAAAAILARGGERAAVPTLIGWLSDPEPQLREAASSALAAMADARATAALTRTLGDADADVRRAAVLALGALETADVIVPILGRLDDSHPRVREAAAGVLGELGDERAVVPLIGKVQDLEAQVRIRVIQALAQIGDARAVAALLGAARDSTVEVRTAAIAALGRMRAGEAVDAVVTLLGDQEPRVRQRACLALGEIGTPPAIAALVRALARAELRRDAMDALARIGPAATPDLVARLVDPRSIEVATAALETLGRIGDVAACPMLIELLGTGRVSTTRVLLALGQAGDERAMVPILERLSDRRSDVRLAAADALEPILLRLDMPDGRAADPLLVLAGDPSEALRLRAVRLLGLLRAGRSVPTLLRIIDEDGGRIRLEAVRALGRIGSRPASPQLFALLDDGDSQLRTEAALAIGRIADPASLAPLMERVSRARPSDRAAALHALSLVLRRHPRADAIELLGKMARGRDESLATRAIDALSRTRSEHAAFALAPVASTPSEWMRAKVMDALGPLPGEAATALLLRGLLDDESPSARAAAAFSLSGHPGPPTVRALVHALDDEGWGVAANAATALARLGAREAASGLCARTRDRDPLTTVTALRAAAILGGPCANPRALAQALRSTRSLERETAARLLAGATDPGIVDRLRSCAQMDHDLAVGRACDEALKPRAPERSRDADWTELYLYSIDGRTIRPHSRYLLVLANGELKAGVTDLHGFARAEPVPPGSVRVADPDALGH